MFSMSQSELDTLARDRDFQAPASGNLCPSASATVSHHQDHVVINMDQVEEVPPPLSPIPEPAPHKRAAQSAT